MSELRVETWSMPGADLGPENPLPTFQPAYDSTLATGFPNIPEDMNHNMKLGRLPNYLPYSIQDGYTRERQPRTYRTAVLENETLRATFLLELGGRLWSLVHKPTERELLDVNTVFQPANLAMRNAWFAGGVEWNIGAIAHSAFTCSPLFAARVEGTDGTPILRLYEYERIRQVAFQIDAYLPDGSPLLFIRVHLTNPHNHEIPMYWWSNIAVPETENTRVLVPAEKAYRFSTERDGLDIVPVPQHNDLDITYSARSKPTVDYFFHLPSDQRPWITALDGEGKGLIQVSTNRLKGRKLFLWGTGPGGKRWQEFLAEPGHTYLEIQAGLARSQLEHVPMPANANWSWLEGYGYLEADADRIHGADWAAARQAVEDQLEALMPRTDFETEHARGIEWVNRPPTEILQRGSGWGALERLRREATGEPLFCSEGLVFDFESLQAAQVPWVTLLKTGRFPDSEVDAVPEGYLVDLKWRALLEAAARQHPDLDWMAWLHLGVMRYQISGRESARQAWKKSLELAETPWGLRNLAVLAQEEGNHSAAADLYKKAHRLRPALLPLLIETGRALLAARQPQDWLNLFAELPPTIQQVGRIRLLEGEAALAVGDFARVEKVFADQVVVDDLREGERSLSQLWFDYHEQRLSQAESCPIDNALRARVRQEYPVPALFDFRMVSEEIPE